MASNAKSRAERPRNNASDRRDNPSPSKRKAETQGLIGLRRILKRAGVNDERLEAVVVDYLFDSPMLSELIVEKRLPGQKVVLKVARGEHEFLIQEACEDFLHWLSACSELMSEPQAEQEPQAVKSVSRRRNPKKSKKVEDDDYDDDEEDEWD